MNILLVTENLQDAGLIRNELTSRIPDMRLDITQDVPEAIRLSTIPGRYNAVLLDSALEQGDPLAVVRAIRGWNIPIAVIGLAGPDDSGWGAEAVGAGADDCVLKRAGFVDSLPEVLSRACGQRCAAKGAQGPPRTIYVRAPAEAHQGAAPSPTALKAVPPRRDPTGASCILLRDLQATETVPEAAEQRDSVDALKEQLQVSEEERRHLQENVRALESRLARQIEEFQTERRQWDLWRTLLKQRLAAVEESRATIEHMVLPEEERQQ